MPARSRAGKLKLYPFIRVRGGERRSNGDSRKDDTPMGEFLDRISGPEDVKALERGQLPQLAEDEKYI